MKKKRNFSSWHQATDYDLLPVINSIPVTVGNQQNEMKQHKLSIKRAAKSKRDTISFGEGILQALVA